MKRLFQLVLVLIIVACGAYLYLKNEMIAPPLSADYIATENAMAVDNVVAMGFFNLEHARKLEKLAQKTGDTGALPSPQQVSEKDVVKIFHDAGYKIRHDADQVLAVATLGEDKVNWAAAVIGSFSEEKLSAAINGLSSVAQRPLGETVPFYVINSQDKKTCKAKPPLGLYILPNKVLIGTPELVQHIQTRLSQNAAAGTNLAAWQAYRQYRFMALEIQSPKNIAERSAKGFTRMILNDALEKNPLNNIYVGAEGQIVPPGVSINIQTSATPEWVSETAGKIQKWKSTPIDSEIPSLQKLQSYLTVNANQNTLELTTHLNAQFKKDIAAVIQEGLGQMFGGGMQQTGGGQAPGEQIAEAKDFVQIPQMLDLNNLAYEEGFGGAPDIQTGPFGLSLTSIGLDDNNALQFRFNLSSGAINTLSNDFMHIDSDNSPAQIKFTTVASTNGENLIHQDDCGRKPNQEPRHISPSAGQKWNENNETIHYTKIEDHQLELSLTPDAKLDNIGSIEGEILLRVPTQVERALLTRPLPGRTVQTEQVRFKINNVDNGTLNYTVSGQTDHIIDIRAMNMNGQYLKSQGASGAGSFFGDGKTVSRQFLGEIASVEVFFAKQVENKTYPFSMSASTPKFSGNAYSEVHIVEPSTKEAFAALEKLSGGDMCNGNVAITDYPPFAFCPLYVSWISNNAAKTRIDVMAVDSPLTKFNASLLELNFKEVQMKDGNSLPLDHSAIKGFSNTYGKTLNGYIREDIPLLPEKSEEKVDKDNLKSFSGDLIIHIPTAFDKKTMGVSLGETLETPGLALKLIEISKDNLSFDLRGTLSKLVQIIGYDANGEVIKGTGMVEMEQTGSDHAKAKLKITELPSKLEIVLRAEEETITYPFTFPVN